MRHLPATSQLLQKEFHHWASLLIVCLAILISQACVVSASEHITEEDDTFLDKVQRQTFQYFIECTNPDNGLVMDKAPNSLSNAVAVDFAYSPATIAGVGFALTVFPVGVERGWMTREKALDLTRTTMKFFAEKMEHQHGFFYHFVDMKAGARAMNCEISSIDTAIFLAGALFAAQYFNDAEISKLAQHLYERVDWLWMCNGGQFPSMGWTPEMGFIPAGWDHYSEGLLLHILALGSPTRPLSTDSWNFRRLWGRYKDHVYLINQPLFTHQFPQIWLDLRNKRDEHANYFASSVQATLANRQFCLDLRPSFKTFSENRWGLSACIGPDTYQAYGAPPNPAIVDGTVAPAAAACSIVFTPQPAIAALREYYAGNGLSESIKKRLTGRFGLSDSFNVDRDFVASEAFAINQGPMLLMIENFRSDFVWKHFMQIPCVSNAMTRAGFKNDTSGEYLASNTLIYETAPYMPHLRPAYESRAIPESFSLDNSSFTDPIWNSGGQMIIDKSLTQTIIKPSASLDFKLTWKLLHNSSSIFFKFDLYDPELHAAHPDEQMYHDDCIEIYLNSRNLPFRWDGEHDFQVIISPDATGKNLRVREFIKGGRLTSLLKWKYQRLPNGYSVLLEIPRDKFALDGVDSFGASVAAHDVNASDTVDMKYNWFFPLPAMTLAEIKLLKEF